MESGSTALTAPAVPGRSSRILTSPLTWFFVLAFGYTVFRLAIFQEPPPAPAPQIYFQVPAFAFTNQEAQPYGSAQLEGQVWVAEFFFTHCPTVCTSLTEAMAKLDRRLPPGVRLVSISVDPENDGPPVLKAYAATHQLDLRRWSFLTGDLAQVEQAVVKGFKLPMQKADPAEAETAADLMAITHGSRLVLVDQSRRIRGYFEANEDGLAELERGVAYLLEHKDQ